MGVYIKGLHKERYCIDCPLMMCNADGDWCALQDAETNESFKSWDDMRKHCPLVEIEVPHGRLIDADALEQDAQKRMLICNQNDNQFQKPYEVMRAIALAPTIIQEEDG